MRAKCWLPWAVCVGLIVLAAALSATRTHDGTVIAPESTKAAPGFDDDRRGTDGAVALLKVCTERLSAQVARAGASCPSPPSLEVCLAVPGIRRAIESGRAYPSASLDAGSAAPGAGSSLAPPRSPAVIGSTDAS